MPLSGDQLNTALGMGALVGQSLAFPPMLRGTPSDATFAIGVNDSVSEQFHQVNIALDGNNNLDVTADGLGSGYLIPWLGDAPPNPIGVAVTAGRGLGSYTPVLAGGGPISWVVTGPFTGCYSFSVRDTGNNDIVCAHLITPYPPSTADTIPNQEANVCNQAGMAAAAGHNRDLQRVTPPPALAANEGYVFWMWVTPSVGNSCWVKRVVWALNGVIVQIDNETAV